MTLQAAGTKKHQQPQSKITQKCALPLDPSLSASLHIDLPSGLLTLLLASVSAPARKSFSTTASSFNVCLNSVNLPWREAGPPNHHDDKWIRTSRLSIKNSLSGYSEMDSQKWTVKSRQCRRGVGQQLLDNHYWGRGAVLLYTHGSGGDA